MVWVQNPNLVKTSSKKISKILKKIFLPLKFKFFCDIKKTLSKFRFEQYSALYAH